MALDDQLDACPNCKHQQRAEYKTIVYDTKLGPIRCAVWRFKCDACSWVWGNRDQRQYNNTVYQKTLDAKAKAMRAAR